MADSQTSAAPSDSTAPALGASTMPALGLSTTPALSSSTAGALVNTGMPISSIPAVNVASVHTHVPVTLELKASNFTKWRMLIRVLLGKYDLLHHVNTIAPPDARTPEWVREDYIVRSWLYGSISDEILDIIMAEEQTAQEAWVLITNLFLDNQMTRAVYLEAEFRGLVQGDLSITGYCHRLKALSDALRDVGTPVSDQTLVLNCLRGLNPRFADITTIVTMQSPLPTFAQTRSLLTLRETQLANSTQVANQTALYGASSPGADGNSGGNSNRTGGGNTGGGASNGGNRNGGGYYRKKKNGGGGNSGGTSTGNTGANSGGNRANGQAMLGPWVCFNPYTGHTQQMQQGLPMMHPTGAGLLGPRPTPPASAFTSLAPLHGQAFGTNAPPVPHYALGSATSPAWDTSALMAALNSAATPSTVGEWVMDSGATAHMASDPGSSHQGRDH
ncbi:uncharacterized protein [Lolium perenne]|uniref:uncharacterized protein n=1 Tax=Lolium perenne TaxID=4522 RepID=UPI003A9A023F